MKKRIILIITLSIAFALLTTKLKAISYYNSEYTSYEDVNLYAGSELAVTDTQFGDFLAWAYVVLGGTDYLNTTGGTMTCEINVQAGTQREVVYREQKDTTEFNAGGKYARRVGFSPNYPILFTSNCKVWVSSNNPNDVSVDCSVYLVNPYNIYIGATGYPAVETVAHNGVLLSEANVPVNVVQWDGNDVNCSNNNYPNVNSKEVSGENPLSDYDIGQAVDNYSSDMNGVDANLATIDTVVDAIKAVTDNLPDSGTLDSVSAEVNDVSGSRYE